MSSGTGGSLNSGVGADGGGGHRSACLTGLLRPVVEHLLLPCWALRLPALSFLSPSPLGSQHHGGGAAAVTGTVICHENKKVRLCLQLDPSAPPHLFVELPLIATEFAAGIRDGGWRISLECLSLDDVTAAKPLLEATEVWKVSLNGMKAGLATRPQMTEREARLLEVTRTVSTGAGILPPDIAAAAPASPSQSPEGTGGCKYLRGSFDRVVGSPDSESYYLVDPDGDLSHVLSFFFYRWRR
ncbi:unnamed protein product [Spirodela intermedia]|uniref:Uncharacterized protein n=1 Tax=Spirodela intermedia TaxID=51605 RepID=A0A7I8K830_SPIIN|nr:unnamed protein product [Spirodela intermedia]